MFYTRDCAHHGMYKIIQLYESYLQICNLELDWHLDLRSDFFFISSMHSIVGGGGC